MEANGARKRGMPRDIASAGRCATQALYTVKQGQYLAFIYYYTKIHGRSPSEADMQRFFKVSPPSVHQMVLSLERLGFIERTPGQARSLRVLLPADQLPHLE